MNNKRRDSASGRGLGSMRMRLERLEASSQSPKDLTASPEMDEHRTEWAERTWRDEIESLAWDLVHGFEPLLVVDRRGDFYTLDGRFALGREGSLNVQAWFSGLQRAKDEDAELAAIEVRQDRWERFLIFDEEAAEIHKRLQERAKAAEVPDEYRLPLEEFHARHDIDDAGSAPCEEKSVFRSPEDKEAVRRLTWTLIHDAEALALLAGLHERFGRFVAEES
jgi:hypothetical protein